MAEKSIFTNASEILGEELHKAMKELEKLGIAPLGQTKYTPSEIDKVVRRTKYGKQQ